MIFGEISTKVTKFVNINVVVFHYRYMFWTRLRCLDFVWQGHTVSDSKLGFSGCSTLKNSAAVGKKKKKVKQDTVPYSNTHF